MLKYNKMIYYININSWVKYGQTQPLSSQRLKTSKFNPTMSSNNAAIF